MEQFSDVFSVHHKDTNEIMTSTEQPVGLSRCMMGAEMIVLISLGFQRIIPHKHPSERGMCSATRGQAEALKTASPRRSSKETSEGLPSEGRMQKNAPTPNTHHPQQNNRLVMTQRLKRVMLMMRRSLQPFISVSPLQKPACQMTFPSTT